MKNTASIGILLVFFSLILVLIFFGYAEVVQFDDLPSILINTGRLFGLFGFVLFSWTLFLNTRSHVAQKLFGGLNNCYKYHHNFGKWSFIIIVLHPLFLFLNYLTSSFEIAISFILTPFSFPVLLGKLSLGIMVVILYATFFMKLPYEIWKNLHKFIGIAFILASVHILTVGSSVSFNTSLMVYILSLAGLGIGSYFYKTIAGRYLIKKFRYRISKISKNGSIIDISLSPVGEKIIFVPGQYFFATFLSTNGVTRESHPYSFASDPQADAVRVIIKMEGDHNIKLSNLQNGDQALLEGPYGNFGEGLVDNPQVWIAGGIGVTPFLSMLSGIKKTKVYLFYSVDNKKSAIGLSEFRTAQNRTNKFKFILWDTSINNRISISKIAEVVGEEVYKAEIFICGPRGMVKSLVGQSMGVGIHKNNVHFDEFNLRY